MTVFKNYLKIAKTHLSMIIMYTVIFSAFAILASSSNAGSAGTTFSATKPDVAIINGDNDTVLIKSFTDYIKDNATIIKLENEEEALKDALFFGEVDYILLIPKNFTKDFMQGLKPRIDTMKVPDSYDTTYLSMLLNRYLNIANVYVKSGMDEDKIASSIKIDLSKSTEVELSSKDNSTKIESASYFYNFSNYTLIAVCVSVVALIMNAFNNQMIKRRNIISGIPYQKIGFQLFLGNLCVMTLIWLSYVIISMIMYGSAMISSSGLLMILNSFVFSITTLTIGFLIGSLVRNKEAINGIINVFALGSSFLCGAFVPQQYLGDFVVNLSKVLPSYWFIKNNNDIVKLSNFNFDNLSPIFINIIVVLLFGLLFFGITMIINKRKLRSN